jgi:hypothetical protein
MGMSEAELNPRSCLRIIHVRFQRRYFSLDFAASLVKRSAFNRSYFLEGFLRFFVFQLLLFAYQLAEKLFPLLVV